MITVAITAMLRNYGDVTLTDQLQQAAVTRAVIEQGIGILIATHHCTLAAAFAILRGASQRGASQNRNVRLHHTAEDLVDRRIHRPAS